MTYITGVQVWLHKSDGTHVDFGVNIDQADGLGRWGRPKAIWDYVSRLLGPQVIQHLQQMQGTLDPGHLPDIGDHLVRKEGGAPGKVTDNNPATRTIEVHGWYHYDGHQPTSWWKWDDGPWKRPPPRD